MYDKKFTLIQLLYNRTDHSYYLQVGETVIFRIGEKYATRIQNKEKLEIIHVDSINEMRIKPIE